MGHSTQKPKHAAMVGLGAKVFVGGVRAAENYRRDAVREGKKAEKVGKKGGKFRAVRRV